MGVQAIPRVRNHSLRPWVVVCSSPTKTFKAALRSYGVLLLGVSRGIAEVLTCPSQGRVDASRAPRNLSIPPIGPSGRYPARCLDWRALLEGVLGCLLEGHRLSSLPRLLRPRR